MYDPIKEIIRQYESSVPFEMSPIKKNDLEINLPLYLEEEGDYVVFNRKQFDMDYDYNFQASYGFYEPHIALIREETLYLNLVKELVEQDLLVDYLDGFERAWMLELFDDQPTYSVFFQDNDIHIQQIQSTRIPLDTFVQEVQDEGLLNSLCRFFEITHFVHWNGEWYQDTSYVRSSVEDPRQLKLFPDESLPAPAGVIPNCS